MFRIDVPSAVPALPAPQTAGTPGYFGRGDIPSGQLPTTVTADFLNMLQEEIANVVTGAGITLSKTTRNQLFLAIQSIVGGSGYVLRAGDTMTGPLVVPSQSLGGHATRKDYVDALVTAAALLAKMLTVDGSGCGFDADLLDGHHASDFAMLSAFSTGSNGNGRWWTMPDGSGGTIIEQQGRGPGASVQGTVTITFPTAFAATDYDLQLTAIIASASDFDDFPQEIDGTRTTTSSQVFWQDPSSGGSSASAGLRWRAKGY